MFHRLALQPELLVQLREHPHLIDAAVEEILRYDSPVQGLFRTNAEQCEIGGVTMEPGTKFQLLYASANRDPDVWDDPDEIRFDRDPRQLRTHIAFGWGVHHCIGAALARLEGRLALRRIVAGLESIELIGEPTPSAPFILRGFSSLPVRWRPLTDR